MRKKLLQKHKNTRKKSTNKSVSRLDDVRNYSHFKFMSFRRIANVFEKPNTLLST